MNRTGNRIYSVYALMMIIFLLVGIAGCSTEAKIERHWKKAEKYYSEEKFREAAIEYKNVIKLKPSHATAYYKLAMCQLNMRMFQEAFANMSRAIELDPKMIDARHHLGTLYLLSGETDKAREQAMAILKIDSTKSLGHMLLGSIYLKENNLGKAIEESLKAVQGDKKLEAYLQLSRLYELSRDLNQAEVMLKQAVKFDDAKQKTRFALAEFYVRTGKKEAAEQEYLQAVRNSPKDSVAAMKLGSFYV
ncbi:MAG: hypothetical protein CVU70_03660, partial [Deltaproteobacteria bacterium HGW-Deltaproteobacteria-5]